MTLGGMLWSDPIDDIGGGCCGVTPRGDPMGDTGGGPIGDALGDPMGDTGGVLWGDAVG